MEYLSKLMPDLKKRLLKLAISQLGLFEPDALDLDSPDISWGSTIILQLRDLPLSKSRLKELLQFPTYFTLTECRVLYLRLEIPINTFNNPTIISIEGIRFKAEVSHTGGLGNTRKESQAGLARGVKANFPRTAEGYQDVPTTFPTTDQLAESLLAAESPARKAELKAAFVKSWQEEQRGLQAEKVGLGWDVPLQKLLSDFSKGIVDRSRAVVKDIQAELTIKLPSTNNSGIDASEDVTICFDIDCIDIPSVSDSAATTNVDSGRGIPLEDAIRARHISISGIHGGLLSTSALSSFMTQLSRPPSPALSRATSKLSETGSIPKLSPPKSTLSDFKHSKTTTSNTSPESYRSLEPSQTLADRSRTSDLSRGAHPHISVAPNDDFGRESEALSASEMLDMEPGPRQLLRIESDMANSILSESSESFLSRSPSRTHRGLEHLDSTVSTKHDRFEGETHSSQRSRPASEPDVTMADDLSRSKFFSTREARSMYMSAMGTEPGSPEAKRSPDTLRSSQSSPDSTRDVFHDAISSESQPVIETTSDSQRISPWRSNFRRFDTSGSGSESPPASLLISHHEVMLEPELATPRTSVPMSSISLQQPSSTRTDSHSTMEVGYPPPLRASMVKTIFAINSITISLPPMVSTAVISKPIEQPTRKTQIVPGAFSMYESQSPSMISSISQPDTAAESDTASASTVDASNIAIHVSDVVFSFDLALIRLMIIAAKEFPMQSKHQSRHKASAGAVGINSTFVFSTERCILRFEESLKLHRRNAPEELTRFNTQAFSQENDHLLRLLLQDLCVESNQDGQHSSTKVQLGRTTIGFPDEHILSFNQELKMRDSVRDILAPAEKDISIAISQFASQPRHIEVNTAPLHVIANVDRLSEILDWLGGLSTVLDLGSSMKSTLTVTESEQFSPNPKVKGVHFEIDEPTPVVSQAVQDSSPPHKINVRIGGLAINVIGKESSVSIEGSAVKIVFRDGAIRTAIDRVKIIGPLLKDPKTDPALVVIIDSLQLSYLDLPKESDLTRLLALLSPSQDKDDEDDDILLDTLLSQRRKGGLLRLSMVTLKSSICHLEQFKHFAKLGDELSQLSSVTKYLPEDDKPGLLILASLGDAELDIDLNNKIQGLTLTLNETQLAIVTFPSLFLTSIDRIQSTHAGLELIGSATPNLRHTSLADNRAPVDVPGLTLKFIAGEMEPTLRVKVHDIRFEYHVSTIMAALGLNETASGEIIVAEMVSSIANITTTDQARQESTSPPVSGSKPWRLSIKLRDVAVGLNPKAKPARGLFVLVQSEFNLIYDKEKTSKAHCSFDIKRAFLMLIDDKSHLLAAKDVIDPNIISGLGRRPTQLQCLEAVGYVFIGQISSANISGKIIEHDGEDLLKLQVKNELFVLETCADSTQTMLTVFGGLAPPMPPRKGNKYRTSNVMPITDLLSSFSGQEFTPSPIDEEDEDYADALTDASEDETGTIAFGDGIDFGTESVMFDPKASVVQDIVKLSSSIRFRDRLKELNTERVWVWKSYSGRYELADSAHVQASTLQIIISDSNFIWNLYDGYDWQATRDTISRAVDDIEAKAEAKRAARRERRRSIEEDDNETVIGDTLFNSIYIGISVKEDPRELSRKINNVLNDDSSQTGSYATSTTMSAGGLRTATPRIKKKRLRLGRSRHHKMTIDLKGLSGRIIAFPPESGETQTSIDIGAQDLEIFDNMNTSTWRKFATYMRDAGPRTPNSNIVDIAILLVKPDKDLLASDFVMKVTVSPLRLHVDQDAQDFLTRFFEFRTDTESKTLKTPVEPPHIQRFEINAIPIKLDFKPKRVDWKALRAGKTSEFTNFMILEDSNMVLKRLILYGVSGFDKLGQTLNDFWTPEVKANQLHSVLAGLAPVRPFVDVGLGVRDLVVVPMREYQKDGRLVRAVSKGVMSFGKKTTTGLVKLGAKLAIGTHTLLSNAEGLLAADSRKDAAGDDLEGIEEQSALSPYANQPVGVVQGLRGAYRGLERDLLLAKDAVIAMPGEVMDGQTPGDAATAFLRTAPLVILRPAMGITQAVGTTLMGATNSLDKEEKRRNEDKYKHR